MTENAHPELIPGVEPYYHDAAGIAVYHGDCRELLPLIPMGSVDVVLTDPPYGIVNQFGENDGPSGLRRLQFDWDGEDVVGAVVSGLGMALDLCKASAAFVVFTSIDLVGSLLPQMRARRFTAKPAAWVKACPPPAGFGNWWP
jgi:hypothetical protein